MPPPQDWLLGKSGDKAPSFLRGSNAVVWARDYSMSDERSCDCDKLRQVLGAVPGAGRMVVRRTRFLDCSLVVFGIFQRCTYVVMPT